MSKWVHEINQPLTAINNYAATAQLLLSEQLRSSIPLSDFDAQRIVQWLDEITKQTGRIAKLVEQQERLQQDQASTLENSNSDNSEEDNNTFRG